jgi:SMI1 / KNR4 family (SUKH-1)
MRLSVLEKSATRVVDVSQEGSDVVVRSWPSAAKADVREERYPNMTVSAWVGAQPKGPLGYVPLVSPDPVAEDFFTTKFEPMLAKHFDVVPGTPSDALLTETEQLYGVSFAPDVQQHLRLRSSAALGYCNFGEWRIWDEDMLPTDLSDELNTFEEIVSAYSEYSVRMVMSDMIQIGTAGNGDCYLAFLDPSQPECTPVMFFDHETDELTAFADSMASLAWLNHMYVIDSGDVPSKDALVTIKKGMKGLAKRVSPSWHYREVVENAGTKLSYEDNGVAPFLFLRSHWVALILKGDTKGAIAAWEPLRAWHADSKWTESLSYHTCTRPSRALYWLATKFFLDQPELAEAIALAGSSPSRLVRDAARTFAALSDGSQTLLGGVDLLEARARFKAGVEANDPALKARLKAAEAEANARIMDETQRAFAAKSADDVAGAIWSSLASLTRTGALLTMLLEKDPSLAESSALDCTDGNA